MNWQPIETAPKDGAEFLGWSNGSYHVVQSHGFERSEGGHAWFNGDVYVYLSHWQPLPAPPTLEG